MLNDTVDAPPVTPAPWTLTGQALIMVVAGAAKRGHGLTGRFSTVVFVDYATSDVGPYRELLHVPHLVRWQGKTGPTIDHIWVTSGASAVSGNHNWGLTKSVAHIERTAVGDGLERWEAADRGGDLGSVVHKPFGPAFPVIKPGALGKLLQVRNGSTYTTPVSLKCRMRPTRIQSLSLDPSRVENLASRRVVAAFQVTGGTLGFGIPDVTPLS